MNRTFIASIAISILLFSTTLNANAILTSTDTSYAGKGTYLLEEVEVTSSKVRGKIFNSSASIEKINSLAISLQPSASFFDAVDNLKGVQMTTAGIGFRIVNARGFNSTTNARFLQLIDGVDNQTPGLQYSIGNIAGVSELDVESVEVLPGVSSAIYGLNALNGTLQTLTKNPFIYTGLSVYQRTGINHVDGRDNAPALNTETSLRYAQQFRKKWAFKINASYLAATDWKATNQSDVIDPSSPYFETLTPSQFKAQYPYRLGSNKVNTYGDELTTVLSLKDTKGSEATKNYTVHRTGYQEKDLVTYQVKNWKVDAALHYKITPSTEAYATYRVGYGDVIFQRGNRFQLNNHGIHQILIGVKGENFSWKAYTTIEVSLDGHSSNLRVLGDNLERRYSGTKTSDPWAKDFKNTFEAEIADHGATKEEAEAKARAYADRNRAAGGSPALRDSIQKTVAINNWTSTAKGARFVTLGKLYHTEGQYAFTQWKAWFDLNVGFDARLYQITPDGNNFQDLQQSGNDIWMYKVGVFAHAKKALFQDKFVLEAAIRLDKNQYFDLFANPRISGVYHFNATHNLRFSYQNGYRYPTMWESFAFLNNGGVIRTGGVEQSTSKLHVYDNSFSGTSVIKFVNAVKAAVNSGTATSTAIQNHKDLLKPNHRTYIQPEYINAFEVGYRGLIAEKLYIDAEYYFNISTRFIGNLDAVQVLNNTVPNTIDGNPKATEFATLLYKNNGKSYGNDIDFGRKDSIQQYKIHTNSIGDVYSHGGSIGLKYYWGKAILNLSYTYADIFKQDPKDALVLGFNTPKNSVKASVLYPEIFTKNLAFSFAYRWNESYLWESFFVTATIPETHIFDVQLSYKINLNPLDLLIKLGGTDIFNQRYVQVAAGPRLGATYYLSLQINLFR